MKNKNISVKKTLNQARNHIWFQVKEYVSEHVMEQISPHVREQISPLSPPIDILAEVGMKIQVRSLVLYAQKYEDIHKRLQ